MTRLMLITVLVLVSGHAWAVETCKTDVGGTFKTKQPELRSHSDIMCQGCREVNAHPQDLRNFMWNWAILGRGGTLTPGTNGLGRYIVGFRLNQQVIVTPIFGNQPGSNVMIVPVSNDHGQSASVELELIHNIIGLRTSNGFTVGINTGIREFNITVTNANGDQTSANYSVAKMQADFNRAGYKMPVPADAEPDNAKAEDCLNNLGEKRPPDSQMEPPGGPESQWPDNIDPYERWWDEEEAYGGRVPDLKCGIVSISGGGSRETCGWFWF